MFTAFIYLVTAVCHHCLFVFSNFYFVLFIDQCLYLWYLLDRKRRKARATFPIISLGIFLFLNIYLYCKCYTASGIIINI